MPSARERLVRLSHRLPRGARARIEGRDVQRLERIRRPVFWGNLRRRGGFALPYGHGRGRSIDRFYIQQFLEVQAAHISGRCLEVYDDTYIRRYGRNVTAVEVLDIDETNPEVTLVADLREPGSLSGHEFDCMVVTQTLHLIPDMHTALGNLVGALAAGGTLLVTAPVMAPMLDPPGADYWRITPLGLQTVADSVRGEGDTVEVLGLGNRQAALGYLLGLAQEDMRARDLVPDDGLCPLVSTLVFHRATSTAVGG